MKSYTQTAIAFLITVIITLSLTAVMYFVPLEYIKLIAIFAILLILIASMLLTKLISEYLNNKDYE